jgi:hypothetical protein
VRQVHRQAIALVGFVAYSAALVAFVDGPSGWPRLLASLACTAGALMMHWGWSKKDER